MRIDIVITELETGGAERFCVDLATFLAARQHRVRVIAIGPPPVPPKDSLYRRLLSTGVPCEFLGCRSVRQFWNAKSKLKRLVLQDPPDISQSILWHANVMAAWTYFRQKIPLIGGIRIAERRRWRFLLSRWASYRMKKAVCVSESTLGWCRDVERLDATKLMVIPNGIDINTIEKEAETVPNSNNIPLDAPILLFVGRLDFQKGIDVLMNRADALLAALPEHHLVIIGDGPCRQAVQTEASHSPHAKRIHPLGQRDDVPGWMKRSQLIILPTRYEGMPNVILEAMSLGKPVATMKVEGVQELLGDECASQSAPRDDWERWHNLVVQLAQNEDHRHRLGTWNAMQIRRHFALYDQLQRYETLYHSVIGTPNQS